MSLVEIVSGSQRWEVQLKGAGRTPYARFADGHAVCRSSIREYLVAEHLHALRIPSARSLSLVSTDHVVLREQPEHGAVVARLAPSWVRFGLFELPASRGNHTLTRELADYVIRHHFPDIDAKSGSNPYVQLLERAVTDTARMVARWQAAGFCHGVMNTDNMSILGLTIDYGPYAFLDVYDPDFICNHFDPSGRYAFREQPRVALWNLTRLAAPLSVLIDCFGFKLESKPGIDDVGSESNPETMTSDHIDAEPKPETVRVITNTLNCFGADFRKEYMLVMRRKFGLFTSARDDDLESTIQPYLDLLEEAKTDYQFAMRALCRVPEALVAGSLEAVANQLSQRLLNVSCDSNAWKRRFCDYFGTVYGPRLADEDVDPVALAARMKCENPNFVLRNWVAKDVIACADKGDEAWVDKVLSLLSTHAFDDHVPPGMEDAKKYTDPVLDWGEGLQCSCSS